MFGYTSHYSTVAVSWWSWGGELVLFQYAILDRIYKPWTCTVKNYMLIPCGTFCKLLQVLTAAQLILWECPLVGVVNKH